MRQRPQQQQQQEGAGAEAPPPPPPPPPPAAALGAAAARGGRGPNGAIVSGALAVLLAAIAAAVLRPDDGSGAAARASVTALRDGWAGAPIDFSKNALVKEACDGISKGQATDEFLTSARACLAASLVAQGVSTSHAVSLVTHGWFAHADTLTRVGAVDAQHAILIANGGHKDTKTSINSHSQGVPVITGSSSAQAVASLGIGVGALGASLVVFENSAWWVTDDTDTQNWSEMTHTSSRKVPIAEQLFAQKAIFPILFKIMKQRGGKVLSMSHMVGADKVISLDPSTFVNVLSASLDSHSALAATLIIHGSDHFSGAGIDHSDVRAAAPLVFLNELAKALNKRAQQAGESAKPAVDAELLRAAKAIRDAMAEVPSTNPVASSKFFQQARGLFCSDAASKLARGDNEGAVGKAAKAVIAELIAELSGDSARSALALTVAASEKDAASAGEVAKYILPDVAAGVPNTLTVATNKVGLLQSVAEQLGIDTAATTSEGLTDEISSSGVPVPSGKNENPAMRGEAQALRFFDKQFALQPGKQIVSADEGGVYVTFISTRVDASSDDWTVTGVYAGSTVRGGLSSGASIKKRFTERQVAAVANAGGDGLARALSDLISDIGSGILEADCVKVETHYLPLSKPDTPVPGGAKPVVHLVEADLIALLRRFEINLNSLEWTFSDVMSSEAARNMAKIGVAMIKRGRTVAESKTSTPFSLAIAGILKMSGSSATVRKAVAAAYATHADSITGASLDDVMAFVYSGAATVARGAKLAAANSALKTALDNVMETADLSRAEMDALVKTAADAHLPGGASAQQVSDLQAYVGRQGFSGGPATVARGAKLAAANSALKTALDNVMETADLSRAEVDALVKTAADAHLPGGASAQQVRDLQAYVANQGFSSGPATVARGAALAAKYPALKAALDKVMETGSGGRKQMDALVKTAADAHLPGGASAQQVRDLQAYVANQGFSGGPATVARGGELVRGKSRGNPFTMAVIAAITKGGGRTVTDTACIAAAALAKSPLSQSELADLKSYVAAAASSFALGLKAAIKRDSSDQVFFSNGTPDVDFAATVGKAKTTCTVDAMTMLGLPSTVTDDFVSTKMVTLRESKPIPGINPCSHGASGYLISSKALKAAPHNYRITKWRHIEAPPDTTTNLAAYKDTFDWNDISCDCGNSDTPADMVQCSTCNRWFHFHCVGETEASLKDQDDWYCPLHRGTDSQPAEADGEAAAPAQSQAPARARAPAAPPRERRPPRASVVEGERARLAQEARDASDEDEE